MQYDRFGIQDKPLGGYKKIILSFDTGGSGGGAYYMGIARELIASKNFTDRLVLTSGVSAGGVASYLLSTNQTEQSDELWQSICNPWYVIRCGGLQTSIDRQLLPYIENYDEENLLCDFQTVVRIEPAYDQTDHITITDRFEARLGFVFDRISFYWRSINEWDYYYSFRTAWARQTDGDTETKKLALRKMLVGGCQIITICNGPYVKSNSERGQSNWSNTRWSYFRLCMEKSFGRFRENRRYVF